MTASVEHVERHSGCFPYTIVLARTLEEYGYQEPIRKRAREICAEVCEGHGWSHVAKRYRSGEFDDTPSMQATEKALRDPGL